MNWKYLKKLGFRFLVFNLVLWTIMGGSINLAFDSPGEYKYSDTDWDDFSYSPNYNKTEWNILFDSHSHTYFSDGDLSPRQNLLWHISLGFNAMALTDHNTFEGIDEIRQIARTEFNDTIKVLIGIEWTTDRCHLNFILPPDTLEEDYNQLISFSSYTYTPTDQEIQDIIDDVHSLGGIVIVNHYIWSEDYCRDQPSRESFRDWGVDYFETINEGYYDNETYYFNLNNGLGQIAGTDMHEAEPVYAYTTMNVTTFTEQAIFDELKAKRTGLLYDGIPSPYDVEHEVSLAYIMLYPFIKLGEMFEGMYSSGSFGPMLAVFFSYAYGGFILFEILRFVLPWSKQKFFNRKE